MALSLQGYDDVQRFLRDKEVNGEQFTRLTAEGEVPVPASEIKVGDWIVVQKDQRVPADMVFMKSSEAGGASFIRTGGPLPDRRPAGRRDGLEAAPRQPRDPAPLGPGAAAARGRGLCRQAHQGHLPLHRDLHAGTEECGPDGRFFAHCRSTTLCGPTQSWPRAVLWA